MRVAQIRIRKSKRLDRTPCSEQTKPNSQIPRWPVYRKHNQEAVPAPNFAGQAAGAARSNPKQEAHSPLLWGNEIASAQSLRRPGAEQSRLPNSEHQPSPGTVLTNLFPLDKDSRKHPVQSRPRVH